MNVADVTDRKIAVIGLGYVGLPLAIAFSRRFRRVVGFDVDKDRIRELSTGYDKNGEVLKSELLEFPLSMTTNAEELGDVDLFVVAVPTPTDETKNPDLSRLIDASRTVGSVMKRDAIVVYESTGYPGVTEEVCVPILVQTSGLKRGVDFKVGYSPERINPGDKVHTLKNVVKVVAAEDAETLETIAQVYETVVEAGVHRASSIEVAEAAKVIENIQRDLNIALMNELAFIFDRHGIRTKEVLEAAGTKWNFLSFTPGLVGGHCIGVDPYYLTTKAEELGYHPQVILAGRRINDSVGAYVGQRTVKLLVHSDLPIRKARIGILGMTYKENVHDIRNSRVPDIVNELEQFGIDPMIHDPHADEQEVFNEYGVRLKSWDELHELDGMIYAVPHDFYRQLPAEELLERLRPGGVLVDVKSAVDPEVMPPGRHYWSL